MGLFQENYLLTIKGVAMKKNLSIRFNELIQSIKQRFMKKKRNDDDDWFDHPYAIF
jgi:hypothetical protein